MVPIAVLPATDYADSSAAQILLHTKIADLVLHPRKRFVESHASIKTVQPERMWMSRSAKSTVEVIVAMKMRNFGSWQLQILSSLEYDASLDLQGKVAAAKFF